MSNMINYKLFSEIISKYKLFIFDCDGVIWIESKIFKESADCLKLLARENKIVRFLTNNNSKSTESLYKPFKENVDLKDIVCESQIYSSVIITASNLINNYPSVKKAYVIGSDELALEFKNRGIEVIPSSRFNDKYMITQEEADLDCKVDDDINAVIAGFDPYINYYKILYAQRVLFNKNSVFLGTNIDANKKGHYGVLPGTYSMIKSVEIASGRKAEIVSKPHPNCLDLILQEVNEKQRKSNLQEIQKKDILMIGDNLTTDIKFANNAEIDSVLVLSGITNEETIKQATETADEKYGKPTYIFKNLQI